LVVLLTASACDPVAGNAGNRDGQAATSSAVKPTNEAAGSQRMAEGSHSRMMPPSPPPAQPPPPAQSPPAAPSPAMMEGSHPTSKPKKPPYEGPAAHEIAVPKWIADIVAAPDRSKADRALDGGRKPGQLLAFFGVKPGMRVAELGAGTGYTSELLARAVGKDGVVYAQNPPFVIEHFGDRWSKRLAKPVMANVVRIDRDWNDPLPASVKNLDAVFIVLFYHDTVWMGADRSKMNAAVFRALKSGGEYVIVDHSARKGVGAAEAGTLHRIEESVVREEVPQVGFKLNAVSDFLRNPYDLRDWNDAPRAAGPRRGSSDRFVLKYVKP